VEVDLDDDPSHDERIMQATGGHRTVPAVEVGGRLLINPAIDEIHSALGSS
jgi:glutaredoxin